MDKTTTKRTAMGFITVEIVGGPKRLFAQLSDSKLLLKRVMDVIGITTRRADLAASSRLEYKDEEGDWVLVLTDEDVAEMFRASKTVAPAALQVPVIMY